MRVLVTGGAGFIGSALVRHLVHDVGATVLNIDKLTYAGNLNSLRSVADMPDYHFLQASRCRLSTFRRDYVFDGTKATDYVETDPTAPLGIYGRSKLAGERSAGAQTANLAILRTAWVYSPFGGNFVKTMLRLAASNASVRVVADQHGNPTSAHDIADAILSVAGNLAANPDPNLRGIFHMTAEGSTSWADFARAIFEISRQYGGPVAEVVSIGASEYPTAAARPSNSRLDCSKLWDLHHVRLPAWKQSLETVVKRLVEGESKP